ncbi:glycosyltransferase [bacterium]
MKFSIIVPAHNEENYIQTCLDSISLASKPYPENVEVIVVINRCTDDTEALARHWGAKIVYEGGKNLSKIRNAGASHATGEIIVTIDADSWMTPNMLVEIDRLLQMKKYIGGGVCIYPERTSPGIWIAVVLIKTWIFLTGVAGGLFWCFRHDFEAIGGFNEQLVVGEDLDFARRLKQNGKQRQLKFTTLRRASITTSCRKFDYYGEWLALRLLLFRHKELINALSHGLPEEHQAFADRYFYECERSSELSALSNQQTEKHLE